MIDESQSTSLPQQMEELLARAKQFARDLDARIRELTDDTKARPRKELNP
jgi:hypothetical protein